MAASQHILQIPFFTLKELPFILEDKKSSKDDFLWYGKKNLAASRFSTDIGFEPAMGSDSLE